MYRLVGVTQDVTALRETEERFQQAQKMDAIGRLAGGVAHDFNNLLTVIIAETDLLIDSLDGDASALEMATGVRTAAQSAATLTRQLLSFSRRQITEPTLVDVNDLVSDVAKMLRRVIGEQIRIDLQLGADVGSARVDRGQFEQVLTNLAVNARDAMPNGGVFTITTATSDEYAEISLSDTGTGMSAETRAHLFEPFFTTKSVGKGTGLGLAICYGIVKHAGGYITADSEPGEGSTFRVYLPRIDAPAPQVVHADVPRAPHGTESVLLVEDDDAVRRVGVMVLRRLGYSVVEARDGAEAIQIASAPGARFDLLFTDVVMPGIGGRELAERILAIRPEMRVLYTSGYTDDVILQHQLFARDVAILHKPYTQLALGQKVREVLDAK